MVRRMDRQGEVLIGCRKCSGCARQKMGPKLMNCCKPWQMDIKNTEGCSNDSRSWKVAGSLPRRQGSGRLKDKREGLQEKSIEDCGMSSRREDSWVRKGYGMLPRKNVGRQRCPKKDGDPLREYKAMHEENFLSSWLKSMWKAERKGRRK